MVVNQTAAKILTVAQDLLQRKGFNGFSYRDLATEIGIKTSSIHYYFPTKDDLALNLVRNYRNLFQAELQKISLQDTTPTQKLTYYVRLYGHNIEQANKFCLCGMLAAEISALSLEVKQEVQLFFQDNESWLQQLIDRGKQQGEFNSDRSSRLLATQLIATLEGAMLVARTSEQPAANFHCVAETAMASLR